MTKIEEDVRIKPSSVGIGWVYCQFLIVNHVPLTALQGLMKIGDSTSHIFANSSFFWSAFISGIFSALLN